MKLCILAVFLSASFSLSAQTASQPDVSGTWVSETNGDVTWVLSEKDDALHVIEKTGDKPSADFTCPLNGQSCDVKIAGHSGKVDGLLQRQSSCRNSRRP